MVDFKDIYAHQAHDYDRLVRYEDYQQNIRHALDQHVDLTDKHVIEFGAGTGRLSVLLAKTAQTLHVTDISVHMLDVAQQRLQGQTNCVYTVTDNRQMPFRDTIADVAISGWSFGHLVGWYPEDWKQQVDRAVGEMLRLLRPNGTAIIFETMGTGQKNPAPPTPELAAYYRHLETQHGFSGSTFRTDYQFPSVAEAERLTRFFFGGVLAKRVAAESLLILPECTGMWRRTK